MIAFDLNSDMPVFINTCFEGQCRATQPLDTMFVDVEEIATTGLRSLPSIAFYSLIAVLVISLLSGSYFKTVLYRTILNEKFKERPINILIFTQAVIHHITHVFTGVNIILSISFDGLSNIIFGEIYCEIVISVAAFGIFYLAIGGFFIALFRILYIRHNHWTKYVAGEQIVLAFLLTAGLVATTILTFLLLIEPSNHRVVYNECIGRSSTALSIVDEFKKAQGKIYFNARVTAIFLPDYHYMNHIKPTIYDGFYSIGFKYFRSGSD